MEVCPVCGKELARTNHYETYSKPVVKWKCSCGFAREEKSKERWSNNWYRARRDTNVGIA